MVYGEERGKKGEIYNYQDRGANFDFGLRNVDD